MRPYLNSFSGKNAISGYFYRTQVSWGPIYVSQPLRRLANLTDVTLADQATNSIQADNANMAIQGNVAMKVTQSRGQL